MRERPAARAWTVLKPAAGCVRYGRAVHAPCRYADRLVLAPHRIKAGTGIMQMSARTRPAPP
jgi:hypothetical protein